MKMLDILAKFKEFAYNICHPLLTEIWTFKKLFYHYVVSYKKQSNHTPELKILNSAFTADMTWFMMGGIQTVLNKYEYMEFARVKYTLPNHCKW